VRARQLGLRALVVILLLQAATASVFAQPSGTPVASTQVTFLLVNDIYLMSEQMHPDGKPRGGFARLAAVVKAERAKGGHVVFAHAGDTLSPSLMSGLDRGAHIITLTNMVPPDIFVPGNHEFDFGKATFLQRMGEAKFPLYAANLRAADGAPIPGMRDRSVVVFDGVRIGITGVTLDDTPRVSSSEDLRFTPTVDTLKAQADALRREGADIVVGVAHADQAQDTAIMASRSVDLLLSGHDHDLRIEFDGRNALIESSYDAHYIVAVDISVQVSERDGRRLATWWPQFRVIDTATVVPDAEVGKVVAALEAELSREMDVPLGTTAVELDSRNATLRTREAAIGNLIADAMRVSTDADAAVINGGGIRSGRVYAPGAAISRRDILAELPFNNRMIVLAMSGADLKRAMENGLAQLPQAGGRFPQVSGITLGYELARPPGARITNMSVAGAPLVPDKIYRVTVLDFLARGGDAYETFRDARRITPDNDAPLVANAVMVYVRRLGTVRAQVEGRIVSQ
jgi:5'-nucleotidase / UDP-sugar diphosphatase